MKYRYKRAILNDIERLDRDKAFTGENGIWDSGEKLKELDEVYRKAHAFDRIENYLADQQAYDWDDEYTLGLVAEEIEKVVMERDSQ